MNQIVEWLIISGVVLSAFSVVFYYAEDTLSNAMLSQHDKIELQKKQTGEQITLIDVMSNPLRIDVFNTGIGNVTIKKLYVDGVADESFIISDRFEDTLDNIPVNELVTITPSASGSMVKIITHNNKIFSFE